MPLVELRTVNEIRYVTDSNGIVAFDEPGLLGRKVFSTSRATAMSSPKTASAIEARRSRPAREARRESRSSGSTLPGGFTA